jgi:hypothetical protein
MASRRLIAAAAAAAALAFAAPAGAQTPILDAAAEGLRGHAVYVHPGTTALSSGEAQRLEEQIADEGSGPIYISILPAGARREAGGTAEGVVLELNRRIVTTNPPAVHAAVVGNQFRAVNRDVPAGDLATQAFRAHSEAGVAAVLSDFISRVGDVRAGTADTTDGEDDSGFPRWLLVMGGAIAAVLLFRGYRRRQRRERELGEVKALAREDLVALADDVVGLDEEVEANPEAKAAYLRAMESYQRADDSFDRARSPEDISRVTAALADSRYEMETAKAHLAGAPLLERRSPCFFDPRHGTSVQDVTWMSPYGGQMTVPACEADARRINAGEEPDARQITVNGRQRPFWEAPAYYQPWAFGFFGLAAGGLLLGSAFTPEAEAGGFSDLGGGDFGGGGDLGGGDFGGGGDWGGGGDFGGGGDGGGF